MMKNYCLLLLLLLMSGLESLQAQRTATEHIVYALFDKPEKVQWLNHYHGRIDGINEVAVTLAFDGKRCRGLLTYLRSKEAIQLQGTLKNNLLDLKEINREGQESGALRGEVSQGKVIAEWTNIEGDIAGILELKKVDQEVKTPSYCGENMWIKSFTGSYVDGIVNLIVQRMEEGQLKGMAYFTSTEETYRIVGEIDEEGDYSIVLQDAEYQRFARFMGTFSEETNQKATFYQDEKKERLLSLKLESNLYMGCQEYADYASTIDITYPKTINAFFNEWMEKEVDRWMNDCKQYAQSVQELNPRQQPLLRSSVRAYGWSDVDYYSKKIISGFVTYDKTWLTQPESYSFNYDLEKGKEIRLEDLFKKDFDVDVFVLEYLHQNQVQSKWFKDPEYRAWLKGKSFPFFTIREEGICFCTAYSNVYGRHELTIPYKVLKPYLKKRSPVDYLVSR